MDFAKKRKLEENGTVETDPSLNLTAHDIRKVIEPFTQEQLLDIVQNAAVSHPDVLEAVRSLADRDVAQRKLFIRGIGWETTTESLRSLFAAFGELEEAVVILDKVTGKSKGYGFVTYRHIDGAILALKEPSKMIDGRVAVAQYASQRDGPNTNPGSAVDVSLRKIYVGNVPYDMSAANLLNHFVKYGDIEEGPLGFDKQTGKSKGFALFVYKTPEGAQKALEEPVKKIDGRELMCKLASEGKRGRPGAGPVPGQGQGMGEGMGMQPGGPMQGPYGGSGGAGGYPGYGGGYPGGPGMGQHQNQGNASYSSSMGGQGPPGGYGSGGMGGGYGGYGGPNSGGYGMGGGGSGPGAAGPGLGGAGGGLGGPGGMGGAGRGYGMPPGSGGMPSGGYNDDGHYGSSGYPGPQHQPTGAAPAPRVGPGGMYPNAPPYY